VKVASDGFAVPRNAAHPLAVESVAQQGRALLV